MTVNTSEGLYMYFSCLYVDHTAVKLHLSVYHMFQRLHYLIASLKLLIL